MIVAVGRVVASESRAGARFRDAFSRGGHPLAIHPSALEFSTIIGISYSLAFEEVAFYVRQHPSQPFKD